MKQEEKELLQKVAHSVRALSADAIERQQSGHPGLPLGAAEIGACLFTRFLRHNPANPDWMGRDRFVLSAGHGSMFLYALLYLCGYQVSLEDLKSFRQLHSATPGHPEVGDTPGVETTTGPLGQGIAVATGMAIAQKILAARFGAELFDARIWTLAGDGCIMEGISSESGSLAGTLGLNNLVIIYDSNDVSLDGPTRDCLREDTAKRYEAYGFNVLSIDGYDFDAIEKAFQTARNEQKKPTLIIAKTIIGKHCPNREGKSISHGKFLGPEEMSLFKKEIGWPEEPLFYVPDEVKNYLRDLAPAWAAMEQEWNRQLDELKEKDKEKAELWDIFYEKRIPQDLGEIVWDMPMEKDLPTRKYNEAMVQVMANLLPFMVTGSADVVSCDFTWILEDNDIVRDIDWSHRQIKFGVREFSMAACATGMQLHGMIQPVVGTFLVFSDYMRNALRMAALMRQHVIFVYSHDSIMVGWDGPTHHPVEHLMSLRLIPNLTMIRPGDENEVKAAWINAVLIKDQPVALCFTRQPVASTVSALTGSKAREGVGRGAYLLYGEASVFVDVEIFASGSEIHAAFGAAQQLESEGRKVRVISVPSWELFEKQDKAYQDMILHGKAALKVSVEAGRGLGWERFVGREGLIISQDTFGLSAPATVVQDYFGFTAEKVYEKINNRLVAAVPVQ
jgi:transketolase